MENNPENFLTRTTSLEGKTGFKLRLAIILKLTVASFYRFIHDDCLTKASAISYTTLVSLIPTLTVALAFLTITSGFNEKQSEIFDQITTFLQKNDVKVDISPYLETLREIIGSATQIGTVGFVVLIFSATAILRTLETSFNQIWKVSTSRPFLYKLILFFFILSVGPLLFVVLLGFSSKVADLLRPSHLFSVIKDANQFIWIVGERGTILKINEDGEKLLKLNNLKVDYENMRCVNVELGKFLSTCDPPNLAKENFIEVRSKGKTIYVLSQNGVLLYSTDLGDNWSVVEFLNNRFRDFGVVDESSIMLIKENGDLFKYKRPDSLEKIVLKTEDKNNNATRVRFYSPKLGFVLDSTGNIWMTKDSGTTFTSINLGKFRLEDIAIANKNELYLVGERGSIFRTTDGGQKWKDISHKNITFTKVWHLKEKSESYLFVLNNFDQILISTDQGETWKLSQYQQTGNILSIIPINPKFGLKALYPNEDEDSSIMEQTSGEKHAISGDILAIGQFGRILLGDVKDGHVLWHNLSGGDSIYSPYSILNFIIPLLVVWIFFLMLYILIPNVSIPLKTGMLGALVTSILFLFFNYGYTIYIKSFSNSTMIIYRALAAVPLFLLYIYGASLIVLYGAEVTATIQFKNRYIFNPGLDFSDDNSETYSFYQAVQVLAYIYSEQKNEHKPVMEDKLAAKFFMKDSEIKELVDKLSSANYLLVNEKRELIPIFPADDLTVYEVYKLVAAESFLIPEGSEGKLAEKLRDKFTKVSSYSENELKNIKFSSII